MRFNKLTIKAQELIQQSQSLANQHGHQQIEPEHLLSTMLSERESIATSILLKLGVPPQTVQRDIEQAIGNLPKVSGGKDAALERRLQPVLVREPSVEDTISILRGLKEKYAIQSIRKIKEKQEQMGIEALKYEREGDLAKVAEIRYGLDAELENQLTEARNKLSQLQEDKTMLKEEVEEDDIAEVISRWTGIPVNRMLEGEREKLVQMENRLSKRVVGQSEAISAVSNAVRRAHDRWAWSYS